MKVRTLSQRCLEAVRSGFPKRQFGMALISVVWAACSAVLLGQSMGLSGDGPQSKTTDANANEPVAIESRKPTQPTAKADSRSVDIRIDKTLVLINVTVTDPLNRFVTGLEKEHFLLYEDKVEQEITQFSSEDAPISIGLVFDTSGSHLRCA